MHYQPNNTKLAPNRIRTKPNTKQTKEYSATYTKKWKNGHKKMEKWTQKHGKNFNTQ